MKWHSYDTCKAYHLAYADWDAPSIDESDIDGSCDSMKQDIRYFRNHYVDMADRRTMRGLLRFWKERI